MLNDASVSISDESEREKMRREIFEKSLFPFFFLPSHFLTLFWFFFDASCQEALAEIVHTKDGSRAVREFLAQGSAKVDQSRPVTQ